MDQPTTGDAPGHHRQLSTRCLTNVDTYRNAPSGHRTPVRPAASHKPGCKMTPTFVEATTSVNVVRFDRPVGVGPDARYRQMRFFGTLLAGCPLLQISARSASALTARTARRPTTRVGERYLTGPLAKPPAVTIRSGPAFCIRGSDYVADRSTWQAPQFAGVVAPRCEYLPAIIA